MVGWLTASVIVNIVLALLCLYFWHKGYEREEDCKKYYEKQMNETITFMEKKMRLLYVSIRKLRKKCATKAGVIAAMVILINAARQENA